MSQEGGCITKVRRARKPIATADTVTRLILDQSGAPSMIRQPSGYAPVAESVDAVDSKSASGNGVPVRVGPGAPQNAVCAASRCQQRCRAVVRKVPFSHASCPAGTARNYVMPPAYVAVLSKSYTRYGDFRLTAQALGPQYVVVVAGAGRAGPQQIVLDQNHGYLPTCESARLPWFAGI